VGGLRRWVRRIERDARGAGDTMTLVDTETNETFEVPKTAFLHVIGSFDDEEPDPETAPLLERLDRLVDRDTGEPFWLEDMTHTGKAAANAEKEEEHTD
jgi:hypothetical protein